VESCLSHADRMGADDTVSERLRDAASRNTCASADTNK
jgi:hypothetical protein